MEELHTELYHSGKNYVASINMASQEYGTYDCYNFIKNIAPKDKHENKILDYASLMMLVYNNDKDPQYFAKGGFTCSLIYRKGDEKYSEYLFITQRDTPYIFPEEIVCKKYQIEPTSENQETLRASIERRVHSYNQRDLKKNKRCITFEEAEKLEDYFFNTEYFDIYGEDNELQKLRHLTGKKVIDLTPEQKKRSI